MDEWYCNKVKADNNYEVNLEVDDNTALEPLLTLLLLL